MLLRFVLPLWFLIFLLLMPYGKVVLKTIIFLRCRWMPRCLWTDSSGIGHLGFILREPGCSVSWASKLNRPFGRPPTTFPRAPSKDELHPRPNSLSRSPFMAAATDGRVAVERSSWPGLWRRSADRRRRPLRSTVHQAISFRNSPSSCHGKNVRKSVER